MNKKFKSTITGRSIVTAVAVMAVAVGVVMYSAHAVEDDSDTDNGTDNSVKIQLAWWHQLLTGTKKLSLHVPVVPVDATKLGEDL